MSIYLKCEQITGNVTSPPYIDHVLLSSAEFGIDRPKLMAHDDSTQADGNSRPVMRGFTISKPVDIASPSLFKEATSGKHIPSIEIKFSTISSDKLDTYMMYTLSDCLITAYSVSGEGSDSDKPMETFTIVYSKIMYKFIEFDKNDKPTRPITVGYDLRKGMTL